MDLKKIKIMESLSNADVFIFFLGGGHFAEMLTVADGKGIGVKNCENLPTSRMDGPIVAAIFSFFT